MSDSTLRYQRLTPKIAKISFTHAPVNLVIGATAGHLARIVDGLQADTDLQVLMFDSEVPDFFLNHVDLAHLADFPTADAESGREVWTDITLKLSAAPYITVATIRGRTRGGGNELALALDLRYATMVNRAALPPERDLIAAYDEFLQTTTLPGYTARAAAPLPTGEQALQLEYRLGEFLGLAALRRAAAQPSA